MEQLACFNSFLSGVIHIIALTLVAGACGYLQGVDRTRSKIGKDYILIPRISDDEDFATTAKKYEKLHDWYTN